MKSLKVQLTKGQVDEALEKELKRLTKENISLKKKLVLKGMKIQKLETGMNLTKEVRQLVAGKCEELVDMLRDNQYFEDKGE